MKSFGIVVNIFMLLLQRRVGYTVLALSVLTSMTNIFHQTFLSNCASQPLQTWYGTLARGPTRGLPNCGPPVVYFLFPGSVQFFTLRLGIVGVYSVNKNSEISCLIRNCSRACALAQDLRLSQDKRSFSCSENSSYIYRWVMRL